MPTYKEQYEKIIQAYFKDKINPLDGNFCFCGTLCDNQTNWIKFPESDDTISKLYTQEEFALMEAALLTPLIPFGANHMNHMRAGAWNGQIVESEGYEDALFNGMSAALDVLKDIHEKRGENVDVIEIQFVKRKLETV